MHGSRLRAALLFPVLVLATATCATTRPAADPPPAPAVTLTDIAAAFEVHGGDGDGSIAIWWVEISGTVTNDTNAPVEITRVSWRMFDLGLSRDEELQRTIAPGSSAVVGADRTLTLEQLAALRRWKDGGGSATPAQLVITFGSWELVADGSVTLEVW